MVNRSFGKVLITGGAGFIGSHLVDALAARGIEVCVFDNLSVGKPENIKQWLNSEKLTLLKGDLLNPSDLARLSHDSYETVFHLAANPEVRIGSAKPNEHFQQNLVATQNLLEHLRKNRSTATMIFASTSTVYGEPAKIPTPEDYSPLEPISVYGATKLASEALISAYAHTYGFKAIIYRLANIVGPRSQHGVIHDFIQKLKKNPKILEILGDGTQTKSYLYISDCIDAMLLGLEKTNNQLETYNIGSDDQINVKTIAETIVETMKLKNVKFKLNMSVEEGRGWKGDVKNMLLDITKLKALGWKPKLNSKQAIRKTIKHTITEAQ
jgi:UDP-glucose 4-epimerase